MFHVVIPVIPLQPYIENLWYCNRLVTKTERTLTLPFGHIEMVIKFSGDYNIAHKQDKFEGGCWITGQQIKPTTTTISGQHECIGVVFTPLGWNAFSNIWAGELLNRSFSVLDLWGKEISTLTNELVEITQIEFKFNRLQNFLLKRLVPQKNIATMQEALDIIRGNGNAKKITIYNLCRQLKISRKSLNQHFQKYIGLSASVYLQQQVFNSIIKDISDTPAARLIETGYNYHFFDQAHFIKQFQSFAGMTPGQYLQLVKNKMVDKAYPNFLIY